MNNNVITTEADIQALIGQAPLTIITTFRGQWCPFCRKYLSDLNKAYQQMNNDQVQLLGISTDNEETSQKLKTKLGLHYELYTDENRLLSALYKVIVSDHPIMPNLKQYLQPSILIFHNNEKIFEWIQTPQLRNMGGATSRIPVKEVFDKIAELQNR